MASNTGFVYHDRFLDHDTGAGHPERPERLSALVRHLEATGLSRSLKHLLIDAADESWLAKVHTSAHIKFVRESCAKGIDLLDQGDTRVGRDSYDVAALAVGGVLAGVDAVMAGVLQNAFCAVRPPGHHAERGAAMGFCLFNNVAVAARYAQEKYGAAKVAVVDWDVHHGNGTQEIFYDDPSVLYISTHQYPFYPGTGGRAERGEGRGYGSTLNIPMAAGSGEREYLQAFENEIVPALDIFKPELLIISAGFDAHKDDPLANINLTEESFGKLTVMLKESAEKSSSGRFVSVLEGGYNLDALARSVEAHLRNLIYV